MLRKTLLSIPVALIILTLVVYGVMAQNEPGGVTPAVTVQPNVGAASVVQTVPITLTLTIPSPTGPVTVEVPVFLSLDIRIGLSPQLTTTLQVTPSLVTLVDATPTAEATPESPDPESTVELPTVAATVEPTATSTEAADVAPTTTAVAVAEATEVPLATATPTATAEPVVVAPACPDAHAIITSPGMGQTVSGAVEIIGTATHENFQYYKVEYAQGENIDPNNSFSYLADARVQITGGLLAAFDSTDFVNGAYTIKLSVVDNSGNFPPPCTVSILMAN